MAFRSVMVHVLLLLLGVGFAAEAWQGQDDPAEEHEAELWGGKSEQITRIEFTSEKRNVSLEARQDAQGRFWLGDVDKVKPTPRAKKKDGEDEPEKPVQREQVRFVGVTEAEELAQALMPLQAKRAVGVLTDDQLEDFGFDAEAPASLKVHFEGGVHELQVGDKAPGGSDTYVRLPSDGRAFVVGGNLAGDLAAAESRLMQRALHEWENQEVGRATLTAEGQSRQLVRLEGKRSSWATSEQPEAKDETVTNWMTKFERLRISRYTEKPEVEPKVFVKLTFEDSAGKGLGFVEVAVAPPADPTDEKAKSQFFARSELSRWWGSVVTSTAEQLQQDLPTVVGK